MSIDGRLEYSDYMKKSNGAALLVVMAMIMLLQLVVLHAWFIAGLTSDLAEQRKIRCYNFYMTEAIFEAGMRWIEHDFDALYQKAGACPTGCTFEVTRLLQQWFPQAKKRSIALLVRQSDNKKDTATLMYGVILRELGRLHS